MHFAFIHRMRFLPSSMSPQGGEQSKAENAAALFSSGRRRALIRCLFAPPSFVDDSAPGR
jgi:hypothetical protein